MAVLSLHITSVVQSCKKVPIVFYRALLYCTSVCLRIHTEAYIVFTVIFHTNLTEKIMAFFIGFCIPEVLYSRNTASREIMSHIQGSIH